MKERLYKVCEEILSDEKDSQKLLSYETLDELYEYFLKKVPELTKEEFDEFICEVLETYAKEQERETKLEEDALGSVSGGAMGWKERLTAGALALMSFIPAAGATNEKLSDMNEGTSQSISAMQKVKMKVSDAFGKTKAWVKAHPKLTAGIGLGVIALGGITTAVIIKNRNKSKTEKTGDLGNAAIQQSAVNSLQNGGEVAEHVTQADVPNVKLRSVATVDKSGDGTGPTDQKSVTLLDQIRNGKKLNDAKKRILGENPATKKAVDPNSVEAGQQELLKRLKHRNKVMRTDDQDEGEDNHSWTNETPKRKAVELSSEEAKEVQDKLVEYFSKVKEQYGKYLVKDKYGELENLVVSTVQSDKIKGYIEDVKGYIEDMSKLEQSLKKTQWELSGYLDKLAGRDADWTAPGTVQIPENISDYNESVIKNAGVDVRSQRQAAYTMIDGFIKDVSKKIESAKMKEEDLNNTWQVKRKETTEGQLEILDEFLNKWGNDHKYGGKPRTAEMLREIALGILEVNKGGKSCVRVFTEGARQPSNTFDNDKYVNITKMVNLLKSAGLDTNTDALKKPEALDDEELLKKLSDKSSEEKLTDYYENDFYDLQRAVVKAGLPVDKLPQIGILKK